MFHFSLSISFLQLWQLLLFSEDPNTGDWVKESEPDGGHTDWVRDVAWCPSLSLARQQIASCGQDGRVIVWQILRQPQHRQVVGTSTEGGIPAVGLLKDGSAASNEVWKPVVLATYPDVVWHVSWSLTGNILAVSGGDNKVSWFNVFGYLVAIQSKRLVILCLVSWDGHLSFKFLSTGMYMTSFRWRRSLMCRSLRMQYNRGAGDS